MITIAREITTFTIVKSALTQLSATISRRLYMLLLAGAAIGLHPDTAISGEPEETGWRNVASFFQDVTCADIYAAARAQPPETIADRQEIFVSYAFVYGLGQLAALVANGDEMIDRLGPRCEADFEQHFVLSRHQVSDDMPPLLIVSSPFVHTLVSHQVPGNIKCAEVSEAIRLVEGAGTQQPDRRQELLYLYEYIALHGYSDTSGQTFTEVRARNRDRCERNPGSMWLQLKL